MNNIQELLQQMSAFAAVRKEREADAFRRGERFNVFQVLRMEHDETHLHSALLGELLNPKGSHGLGSEPLCLFLKEVCKDALSDFDMDKAQVYIEYSIGQINEEHTEGGRIDILIMDGVRRIVIENKIYAADQQNQLLRYQNFCGDKPHLLLYLTLDGHEASKYSCGNQSVDYHPISYKEDIIRWLKECLAKAQECPPTREVLSQYIKTLNHLTNQHMESENKEQVLNLMENNLDATIEIMNHINAFREYMVRKYLAEKLTKWAESVGLTCEYYKEFCKGVKWNSLRFKEEGWNRGIGFSFYENGYRGLYYGVVNFEAGYTSQCISDLEFKNVGPWWPYGNKEVNQYANITPDVYEDLRDGKIAEHIEQLCLELREYLNNHKEIYPME
jgi:hypothetical protein